MGSYLEQENMAKNGPGPFVAQLSCLAPKQNAGISVYNLMYLHSYTETRFQLHFRFKLFDISNMGEILRNVKKKQ